MKGERAEEHLIQTPHVDDQNLRLPRDIFPHRFIYQISRCRVYLIIVGLELALLAFFICAGWTVSQGKYFGLITALIILFGYPIVLLTIAIMLQTSNGYKAASANKLQS